MAAALGDGAPTTTPGWLGGLQGWLRPSMAIPAAAAVAAAVWVVAGPFGGDDGGAYRSRGGEETRTDVSSVTLMATDAAGGRRDIRDGDVLQRSDRLGFRYGNPRGDHERLVILGWDQHTLHWYYPEAPHRLAFKVQSGPRALSLRLPFDIRLAETHRPGPLVIAAAFDTSPVVLAAELKAGRVRTSTRGWTVFRVTIEE